MVGSDFEVVSFDEKKLIDLGKQTLEKRVSDSVDSIGRLLENAPYCKNEDPTYEWNCKNAVYTVNERHKKLVEETRENYGMEFLNLEQKYKELLPKINEYLKDFKK